MQCMRGLEIVRAEGKMKFLFADVVGLGMVAKPGELKLKLAFIVSDINDDEGAILRRDSGWF